MEEVVPRCDLEEGLDWIQLSLQVTWGVAFGNDNNVGIIIRFDLRGNATM